MTVRIVGRLKTGYDQLIPRYMIAPVTTNLVTGGKHRFFSVLRLLLQWFYALWIDC